MGQVGLGLGLRRGGEGVPDLRWGLGVAEGQGSGPAGVGVEPLGLASWDQSSCFKSPRGAHLAGRPQSPCRLWLPVPWLGSAELGATPTVARALVTRPLPSGRLDLCSLWGAGGGRSGGMTPSPLPGTLA